MNLNYIIPNRRLRTIVKGRIKRFLYLHFHNNKKALFHVLSKNPPIICVHHGDFYRHIPAAKILKNKKVYFLYGLRWSHEDERRVRRLGIDYSRYKRKFPNHEILFLCNTPAEYKLFGKYKLHRIFCNKNAFIDEKIFRILPKTRKKYNVIYNAVMRGYKRHYLASKLSNLALITDLCEKEYFDETRKLLPNAIWLNFLSGNYKKLSSDEVAEYLNKSKTGLCLSKVEGQMSASAEYLLCGLPIVSTKSKGGRDVFFDKKYVKIVDDTPEAVKRGVSEMLKKNISPEFIRKKTLEKIQQHRERFIKAIQEIYDKEGIDKNFRKEWSRVFIDKMARVEDVAELKNLFK
jgi:glycosyltransferase involved in cell wall biosynthesis